MKVLVACEESQAVCIAFRERGHEAYSCDLIECSGGHPEWHIKGDALNLIVYPWPRGFMVFKAMDGVQHVMTENWDLVIAHPPCTYLTASGAVRLFNADHTIKDAARYEKGKQAAEFFRAFLECDCPHVAIENPVPLKLFELPAYSQVVEPYMFGDPWRKRTCLWLRGLPPLMATDVVVPQGLWVGSTSGRKDASVYTRYSLHSNRSQRRRSKTFPGIAHAMAEQWSAYIESEENNV